MKGQRGGRSPSNSKQNIGVHDTSKALTCAFPDHERAQTCSNTHPAVATAQPFRSRDAFGLVEARNFPIVGAIHHQLHLRDSPATPSPFTSFET